MRAACALILLGWSLLGCPRREESVPDAGSVPGLRERAAANRCALAERQYRPVANPLVSPWLAPGPGRPRVVARVSASGELFWREADTETEASIQSALSLAPHALGWTGRGFVGVVDGRATFTDAAFSSPRTVRRVSLDRAISLSVASREGAVLVAWLQEGRAQDGVGSPWVALLGPEGELAMEPRPLGSAADPLVTLQARWDFGRFVVEGETTSGSGVRSWVLEPDGRDAWTGVGPIACPLSGCVRIERAAAPGGRAQSLRLVSVVDPTTAIDTNIAASNVFATVVSGDRVLMLHPPLQGELGCAIHVYDVGHHTVAHESLSDLLSCAPGSAIAAPSGFVVLEVDPARGIAARALSCGDDA